MRITLHFPGPLALAVTLCLSGCSEVNEQSAAPTAMPTKEAAVVVSNDQQQTPPLGHDDVGLDLPADVITVDAARLNQLATTNVKTGRCRSTGSDV